MSDETSTSSGDVSSTNDSNLNNTENAVRDTVNQPEEEGFIIKDDDPNAEELNKERSAVFETRLADGTRLRLLGNSLFQKKDVEGAIQAYRKALYHVEFDELQINFELQSAHRKALLATRTPIVLNLCQSLMRCKGSAIDSTAAKEVVTLTSDVIKSLAEQKKEDEEERQLQLEQNRRRQKEKKEVEGEGGGANQTEDDVGTDVNDEGDDDDDNDDGGEDVSGGGGGGGNAAAKEETHLAKAYFWRGRAQMDLGDLAEASKGLQEAAKLQPTDKAIRTALQTLKMKEQQHRQQTKSMWGGKLKLPTSTSSSASSSTIGGSTSTANPPSKARGTKLEGGNNSPDDRMSLSSMLWKAAKEALRQSAVAITLAVVVVVASVYMKRRNVDLIASLFDSTQDNKQGGNL